MSPPTSMNQYIIADPRLCIGCNTCMASCSQEHQRHGLQSAPRLQVMRNRLDSAPVTCHQCEDAPCAQVCPVNAINRENEAICLNESLCISCKLCGIACPFGAITFAGSTPLDIPRDCNSPKALPAPRAPRPVSPMLDWVPGVRAVAVKCDLCSFSPDGPACIKTCPTQAITLVTASLAETASQQKRLNAMTVFPASLTVFTAPDPEGKP
ncbi:4Fe-4S dicluster domain-containing protein [Pantoea sp. C2G6]|uniref:4Fe-4S dicluster domain-containing protein n=1 Tax=Pantoea sp. C2G6 TaxID=3243084 RepID=UPI003EDA6DA0